MSNYKSEYKAATKQLKRVGTAHASGDALRAMYADLLVFHHGGRATTYFAWLQGHALGDDKAISEAARELLRDRAKSWDALMEAVS